MGDISTGMLVIGGWILGIDLLYSEWLIMRESFFNFINPIMQVVAVFNMIFFPITWVGVALVIIGGGIAFAKDYDKYRT